MNMKNNLIDLFKYNQKLIRQDKRFNFKTDFNENTALDEREFSLDENNMENVKKIIIDIFVNNDLTFFQNNENDIEIINILSILYNILTIDPRNTNFLNNTSLVQRLIDLLYRNNLEIVKLVLDIILKIAQGSRNTIETLLENHILEEIFFLIQNYHEFFSTILSILSCIVSLGSHEVSLIIEQGFIEYLKNYCCNNIDGVDINSTLSIATLFSNIMFKGSPEDIQLAIDDTIIHLLFSFLDEDYPSILYHNILDGILNCLENSIKVNGEDLQHILLNEEYFFIIQKLMLSKNERTSEISTLIFEKIKLI